MGTRGKKLTVYRGKYPREIRKKADKAWQHMKARCYNEKNEKYKSYGAKGIKIFMSQGDFINWYCTALLNWKLPLIEATVGRLDHSKGYSIDNIEVQSRSDNSKEVHTRVDNYNKLTNAGTAAVRKKVFIKDAKTNEKIMLCESITEAAKIIQISLSSVASCCSKRPHHNTVKKGMYSLEYV